ncbi:MAG: N-acetyltransferase family protein [Candidatus Eremiobacterota bacterium]
MNFIFEKMTEEHRTEVIDIFNHYIKESFAAYPEQCVPYEFYDLFLKMIGNHPSCVVKTEDGTVRGFGMLRPYNPLPTFSHTAEISYFIAPEFCGSGIGSAVLKYLIKEGREKGIKTLLASISALNEGSIRFHCKHGFTECGRFKQVCRKKGQDFDVVWMQLMI